MVVTQRTLTASEKPNFGGYGPLFLPKRNGRRQTVAMPRDLYWKTNHFGVARQPRLEILVQEHNPDMRVLTVVVVLRVAQKREKPRRRADGQGLLQGIELKPTLELSGGHDDKPAAVVVVGKQLDSSTARFSLR
ncbi:hypothetical protein RUM43_008693 [Polyplax serrata]|uniref:Uncharacterized protein n=1 Tax=Polyplax serrata TaxID=468196 RepID=A0AAN8S412_POLSC